MMGRCWLIAVHTGIFLTAASADPAAQMTGFCYEPVPLLTDPASLEILGLTAGEELARWMNESNAYVACLMATADDVRNKMRMRLEDYRTAHDDSPD